MDDRDFREFYRKIVDGYELAPEAAQTLLQRILQILLENSTGEKLD